MLSHYRPGQALWGSRRLRPPAFLDNLHAKAVRLSALHFSRLYPPGDTVGNIAAERIKWVKNTNYPIGIRN